MLEKRQEIFARLEATVWPETQDLELLHRVLGERARLLSEASALGDLAQVVELCRRGDLPETSRRTLRSLLDEARGVATRVLTRDHDLRALLVARREGVEEALATAAQGRRAIRGYAPCVPRRPAHLKESA